MLTKLFLIALSLGPTFAYAGNSEMSAPIVASTAASSAQAPVISRDSRYLYQRTPLKNMSSSLRWHVFRSSSVMLANRVTQLRDAGVLPKELAAESLSALKSGYQEIDKLIQSIETSAINKVQSDSTLAGLVPSAIFVTVGGKFSGNLKIGGGGSVSLGLVLVPVYVERQALFPSDEEPANVSYIEYQMSLIAWPNAEIGVGAGGGVSTRVGLGLIWGPIEKPQDFVGPLMGFSQTVGVGAAGVTGKAGVLNNWSKPGFFQFPFVMAALEMGTILTAEAHWNVSYIIEGSKILAALGYDPAMVPNVERVPMNVDGSGPALTQP